MLVFAAFLGLATVGQTLVALLGGLDLSIPFLIGSSNVGLLYLIGLGIPSPIAVILILVVGSAIGSPQWLPELSRCRASADRDARRRLRDLRPHADPDQHRLCLCGQCVRAGARLAQQSGGDERRHLRASRIPPVIFIWIAVAIALIFGLKNTVYGRYLYALGGNRTSAQRIQISERALLVWRLHDLRLLLALTGSLLLGWSGGGFIGVGDPYLFMTLAAVVIGGTSLLGGHGGYGFTVIGVLVLQVLTAFLVGIGLKFEWQQFIYGLSDPADGRALRALAAYPDTNLGDSSVTNETATTRPPQTKLHAEGGRP